MAHQPPPPSAPNQGPDTKGRLKALLILAALLSGCTILVRVQHEPPPIIKPLPGLPEWPKPRAMDGGAP